MRQPAGKEKFPGPLSVAVQSLDQEFFKKNSLCFY